MEWNIIDARAQADDVPVGAREGDVDFKVEISFHELEIVAFVGGLKIVGQAHFGRSGRTSSQRSSDYLRHFSDSRLTLSGVRIYRHDSGDLIDTAAFTILNLDRVDLVYAREIGDEITGDPALGARPQPRPGEGAPKGEGLPEVEATVATAPVAGAPLGTTPPAQAAPPVQPTPPAQTMAPVQPTPPAQTMAPAQPAPQAQPSPPVDGTPPAGGAPAAS